MLKIKVFDENDERCLTNVINEWLENNLKYEIKDIKFSVSCMTTQEDEQIYCFSALVMYEDEPKLYIPKRYEIIEKVEE